MKKFGLTAVLFSSLTPALLAQRAYDAIEQLDRDYVTRAVGDFNGDGTRDLVRLDAVGPVDSIRIVDGDSLQPYAELSVPNSVRQLAAAGDLDGDGLDDLVVADLFGFAVAYGNGAGGFPRAVARSLPGPALDILPVDVDGDGQLDLVVVHQDPALSSTSVALRCYLTAGGGLNGGPVSTLPASAAFQPVAAVERAGLPLRIACYDTQGSLLLLDLAPTGAITATSSATVVADPFVGSPPVSDGDRGGLVVADFNGDQRPDYAVAFDAELQVVLDLPGGLMPLPVQTLTGSGAILNRLLLGNLAAADADRDGDMDLISRSHPWYGVFPVSRTPVLVGLQNDGQGVFSLAWEQPIATDRGGRVFATDVDHDGLEDFVGAETVLRNDGDGRGPWSAGATQLTANTTVQGLRDLDGDGDPDALPDFAPGYRQNLGSGQFQVVSNVPPGFPNNRFPVLLGSGDFNGDGLLDSMVRIEMPDPMTQGTLPVRTAVFLGQPDGIPVEGPTPWPSPIPGRNGQDAPDLDVDGDGDVDLIADAVYRNDGNGLLTQRLALPSGVQVLYGANLDGDVDLELVGTRGSEVVVVDDVVTVPVVQVLRSGVAVDGRRGIDVADADGDGDQDILIGILGGRVRWYRNDGSGAFALGPFPIVATNSFQLAVRWGDVDGDGRLDVLVAASATNTPGSLRIYRQRPGGQFVLWRNYLMPSGAIVDEAVDLDGDGDLDLAAGQRSLLHQRFRAPESGRYLQLGTGSVGSGGWRPLLGAEGPFRLGETASVTVTRGLGGAAAIVAIGQNQLPTSDFPFPGMTSYGAPWLFLLPATLGGPMGVPGAGSVTYSITVPGGLLGKRFVLQYGILDPGAPFGLAVSNGVEVEFGS